MEQASSAKQIVKGIILMKPAKFQKDLVKKVGIPSMEGIIHGLKTARFTG